MRAESLRILNKTLVPCLALLASFRNHKARLGGSTPGLIEFLLSDRYD